ncbi:MAG TPA: tetratricopeptide repeat protein, partial [Candidatus Omnitrophica bacterium]|nr:tetratricopeptide repeat protein [Candidatus Omnitrophota bacterium]
KLFTYFLLYFFVVNVVKKERALINVVVWMMLVLAGLSFHGLFYYLQQRTSVVPSTFGNPNFFSAYLILMIPLVGLVGSYNFIHKNFLLASILFIVCGVSFYLVLIIKSQGAFLGLAASFVFSIFLFRGHIFKPKRKILITILCFIFFITSILGLGKYLAEIPTLLAREMETGTLGIRVRIWAGTLKMIRERIFTGWGIGTYYLVYPNFRIPKYFLNPHSVNATRHAHNELLEITSEMGVVGLVLFLWIIGSILYRGVRLFHRGPFGVGDFIHAGLMAGVVALLVQNLTGVNLRFSSSGLYLYLTLGLISSRVGCWDEGEKFFKKVFSRRRVLICVPVIVALLFGWFYAKETLELIKSSVHLKKGIMARNRKRWDEAIEEYQKAIFWDAYSLRAYYRLAYAYAETGKLEEAASTYKQLRRLAPDYAQIHYNLGALYLKMGKLQAAKKELERSIELNPYEPKTHCNLAVVYLKLGEEKKAIGHYMRAIVAQEEKKRIDPNLPDFGGSYAGLGNILFSQKKWKEAAKAYEKAVQLNLKDPKVLIRLGECYLRMKDFEKAKKVYEEVFRMNPSRTKFKEIIDKLDRIIKKSQKR